MPTVIDRHEVQRLVEHGAQLVDVMSAREFEAEHIPRAMADRSSSTATTTSET